jgi:hypothetical protein
VQALITNWFVLELPIRPPQATTCIYLMDVVEARQLQASPTKDQCPEQIAKLRALLIRVVMHLK